MGLGPAEPLVLVVDDEATVRQALERALRFEGRRRAQQVALHDGALALDDSERAGLRVQIRLPATEAIALSRR